MADTSFGERMAQARAQKALERARNGENVENSNAGLVSHAESKTPCHNRAEVTLNQSYCIQGMDSKWMKMAAARDMNLPIQSTPCTTAGIEKWLRKLGLTPAWFLEWTGMSRLSEWPKKNPTWNMRGLVGLLLEEVNTATIEDDVQEESLVTEGV